MWFKGELQVLVNYETVPSLFNAAWKKISAILNMKCEKKTQSTIHTGDTLLFRSLKYQLRCILYIFSPT